MLPLSPDSTGESEPDLLLEKLDTISSPLDKKVVKAGEGEVIKKATNAKEQALIAVIEKDM